MLRSLAIATVVSLVMLAAPSTTAAAGSVSFNYYTKNIQDWSGSLCYTDDPDVISSSWGVACVASSVGGTVTASATNTGPAVSVRLTGLDAEGAVCTAAVSGIGSASLTLAEDCTSVSIELGTTATTGSVTLSWTA